MPISINVTGDTPAQVVTELKDLADYLRQGVAVPNIKMPEEAARGLQQEAETAISEVPLVVPLEAAPEVEGGADEAEDAPDASATRRYGKAEEGKSRRTKAQIAEDDAALELAKQAGVSEEKLEAAYDKVIAEGRPRSDVTDQLNSLVAKLKADAEKIAEFDVEGEGSVDVHGMVELDKPAIMAVVQEFFAAVGDDTARARFAEVTKHQNITSIVGSANVERHAVVKRLRDAIAEAEAVNAAAGTDADPFV